MTAKGEAILNIINNSYDHLTAEEVFFKVKKIFPSIVMATVYNNLNALSAEGKIRRIKGIGSCDRFDKIIPHDHCVCAYCGGIIDLDLPSFTPEIEKALGKRIKGYRLNIDYICDKCEGINAGDCN